MNKYGIDLVDQAAKSVRNMVASRYNKSIFIFFLHSGFHWHHQYLQLSEPFQASHNYQSTLLSHLTIQNAFPINGFVHRFSSVPKLPTISYRLHYATLKLFTPKLQTVLNRKNQSFQWRNKMTELLWPLKLSIKLLVAKYNHCKSLNSIC